VLQCGHNRKLTVLDASSSGTKSLVADSEKSGPLNNQLLTGWQIKMWSRSLCWQSTQGLLPGTLCRVIPAMKHQYGQSVFDAFRKRKPMQLLKQWRHMLISLAQEECCCI